HPRDPGVRGRCRQRVANSLSFTTGVRSRWPCRGSRGPVRTPDRPTLSHVVVWYVYSDDAPACKPFGGAGSLSSNRAGYVSCAERERISSHAVLHFTNLDCDCEFLCGLRRGRNRTGRTPCGLREQTLRGCAGR